MDVSVSSSPHEDHSHEAQDPKVGMEFETEQSAYNFYNEYARRVGFGIRKEWRNINKSGIVTSRKLCCSREGAKKEDKRCRNVRSQRDSTRVDCKAHIVVVVQSNGRYRIEKFESSHNHPCTPEKAYMFRSRKKPSAQAIETNTVDSDKMLPKVTFDFMNAQVGENDESHDSLFVQYKNYLPSKRMRLMEKGDAGGMLRFLQKMLVEDPGFVYAIQLDADEQITNIFWADTRMMMDYHAFGDVICFDTTFKTNNHNRPFALFTGVNHHKQIVVFGAALIYDDTTESFHWLFKAFLDTMSGKHPRTILTDQDMAMANAIALVMPNTCHRICVWQLYQNVEKQLGHIFKISKTFGEDFSKCFYDCDDELDFFDAWKSMLEKYSLQENLLLQQLFNEREKWALVYCRNTFSADIQSTQKRELISSILARYLHRNYDILRFLSHFKTVMFERRKAESEADFKMKQSIPVLILEAPMLVTARNLYTQENFKLFQEEYVKGLSCYPKIVAENGTVITYEVSCTKKNCEYTVIFDSVDYKVECSCKNFEFKGILCGHAVRVIDHRGLREVPNKYLLKRWCRDAKIEAESSSCGSASSQDKILSNRCKDLMRRCMKLNTMAAENDAAFAVAVKGLDFVCTKVEEYLSQSPHSSKSVRAGKNSHLAESVTVPTTSGTSNESIHVQTTSRA